MRCGKKKNNCIIIAIWNISPIRSDLEMLTGVICTKIDTLLVSETKLDDKFSLCQLILESFTLPYMPNRL